MTVKTLQTNFGPRLGPMASGGVAVWQWRAWFLLKCWCTSEGFVPPSSILKNTMVSLKYSVLKMSGLGKGRRKSVNIQIQASHVISMQVKLQNLLRTDSWMLQLSLSMKRLENLQPLSAAYLQLLLLSSVRVLPLLMANLFRVVFSEFMISQLKSTAKYYSTLEAFEIVAIPWSKYHLWVMTAFLQADRLCGFTMHDRIVTQSNKQHMIFTIFWHVTCTPQCFIFYQWSWFSFTVSSSFSDLLARQLRCCRRLEIVSNLHWTHKHWKEKCLGCTCPAVLISDSARLQRIRSALLARQNLLLEIGLVSFWTDLLEKTTELWRTFCLFHLLSLPPLTSKSFRPVFGLEGQAVLCLQAPTWLVCPTPKYCAGRNESAWCRLHFWWLIE